MARGRIATQCVSGAVTGERVCDISFWKSELVKEISYMEQELGELQVNLRLLPCRPHGSRTTCRLTIARVPTELTWSYVQSPLHVPDSSTRYSFRILATPMLGDCETSNLAPDKKVAKIHKL